MSTLQKYRYIETLKCKYILVQTSCVTNNSRMTRFYDMKIANSSSNQNPNAIQGKLTQKNLRKEHYEDLNRNEIDLLDVINERSDIQYHYKVVIASAIT